MDEDTTDFVLGLIGLALLLRLFWWGVVIVAMWYRRLVGGVASRGGTDGSGSSVPASAEIATDEEVVSPARRLGTGPGSDDLVQRPRDL